MVVQRGRRTSRAHMDRPPPEHFVPPAPFVQILFDIVSDPSLDGIIRWAQHDIEGASVKARVQYVVGRCSCGGEVTCRLGVLFSGRPAPAVS